MLDIMTASPSVGAWKCQPMSTAEIDAHPDRDRIWATIAAIREAYTAETDKAVEEAEEKADEEAREADGEGYNRALSEVRATAKEAIEALKALVNA